MWPRRYQPKAGSASRASRHSSGQRIDRTQPTKPTEVAVDRPKLGHAMLTAQRGNSSVMNLPARDPSRRHQATQFGPMLLCFSKQRQRRGFLPSTNLIQSSFKRRRRQINPGMRHDRQKFMQARPRDGPGCGAFSELPDTLRCRCMKRCIGTVRIDQNIGVDGDHPPRPL